MAHKYSWFIHKEKKFLVVEFHVHISAPDIKRILNWKGTKEYLSATVYNFGYKKIFSSQVIQTFNSWKQYNAFKELIVAG